MQFVPRLLKEVATTLLVTLLGGFLTAVLTRYSPGYGMDETDLDTRLSSETVAAIHAKQGLDSSLPRFYAHYLERALQGDFGISRSFPEPISQLLLDRAPSTLGLVLGGTAAGWLFAFVLAVLVVHQRNRAVDAVVSVLAGAVLAVPPAVVGLLCFYSQGPLVLAMGIVLVPRLYGTIRVLLEELAGSELLMVARARGVRTFSLAVNYVGRLAGARFASLFGVGTVVAFGCAVPMEALCDRPGIGQLAWKAALSRDLPLLSAIALVVTVFVTTVNSAAELCGSAGESQGKTRA